MNVTEPLLFLLAPSRNGQFYFLKPRGRTDRRVHEDDSLDERDDDVAHDEYEHHVHVCDAD